MTSYLYIASLLFMYFLFLFRTKIYMRHSRTTKFFRMSKRERPTSRVEAVYTLSPETPTPSP